MNRAILIAGLVLSIAVLVTGTIIPNVEAKGKPIKDGEPTSGIKLSCNDRKDKLTCKASSRLKIDAISVEYYDKSGTEVPLDPNPDFLITCQRTQPFSIYPIEEGTYEITVHECPVNTGFTDKFTITVDSDSKIVDISKD